MTFKIAETDLKRRTSPVVGGDIAMLRFGRDGAPPLLFAHANGFCASAYRQMLEALGDRYDVYAVDLRGHGRSGASADPAAIRSADLYGDDLDQALTSLGEQIAPGACWTLAGHSLGAVAATLAAARRDDVGSLRLIEPVALRPILYWAAKTPFWPLIAARWSLVAGARKRRASWPSRADVVASYEGKPLFSTWAPGILEDYLHDGLREGADGVELSCVPAWEAATFAAQGHDFWRALARVRAPIRVLAARHSSTTTPPYALRRLEAAGVAVEAIDGATHLYPFEDPAGAARFLAAP